MKTNLKDSELYEEIKNSDEYILLAYYTTESFIITDDNIDFILEIEEIEANKKLSLLGETPLKEKYILKIKEHILDMKGDYYKTINFISLNKETINEIDLIESDKKFHSWLL